MNAEIATPAENVESPDVTSTESTGRQLFWFCLPYALLLVSQLPLVTVYVRNLLLRQPHYRFLPFLVALIVWLIYSRWPRGHESPVLKNWASWFFLSLGLIFGGGATLFLNPWMAACATCCLLTAWLGRIRDPLTERSLIKVGLLSFLGLQLPLGYDTQLIQYLQRISAFFSSRVLELFGQLHDLPGTILVFPGHQPYFIEEACSGVQSLFTLLFLAGAYGVWSRYSLLRIGVLLLFAGVWAVLMNSLRIMAIPMAEIHLGLDLVEGWRHEALGYVALTIALLLLLSSDQLISIFFQPVIFDEEVDPAIAHPLRHSRWFSWLAPNRKVTYLPIPSPIGLSGQMAVWVFAVFFMIVGGVQAMDVQSLLFSDRQTVKFFEDTEIVALEQGDLPVQIGPWQCTDFATEERERSSELGQHSDIWEFRSPRLISLVSVDQPFPGWHELTKCYTNQGWRVLERRVVKPDADGEAETWPYVEVIMENNFGERGYLLFSFFDTAGQPFDAPEDWDLASSFMSRVQNRLNFRLRKQLFQSETYQVQVFVPTTRDLPEDQVEEIHAQYQSIREQLRDKLLAKTDQSTDG